MENDKLHKVIETTEHFLFLPTIPFRKVTFERLIRRIWPFNFLLLISIAILNILIFLGISIKTGSFEPIFVCIGLDLGYIALMVCWYYAGKFLLNNVWPRTKIHLPEALVRFNAHFLLLLAIVFSFAGITISVRLSNPAILLASITAAVIFIQWATMLLYPSTVGIEFNRDPPAAGYLIISEWVYLKTGLFCITFLEILPFCLTLILIFILMQGIGLFGLSSSEVILRYKSIIIIQGIIPLLLITTIIICTLQQILGIITELINHFVTKVKQP